MISPLRLERLKRGWSQYHIAFNSGVPQVLISYAERGYPTLKPNHKTKIADFFGVETRILFPEPAEVAPSGHVMDEKDSP